MQVFNSTPPNRSPPPGTHKDRTSSLAAQSFQASVTPAGDIRQVQRKNSGYKRTSGCDRDHRVFTHSGDRDFEKKHPPDQRSGLQWSPSWGWRDYHNDDYYQRSRKDDCKSHSFIPAGAEEEDWDADLGQAESSLERAHHFYLADQGGTTQSDDHTMPCDYYSSPPEPQPGSYPGGEQLTSKNTTYAELQGSLITQEKEDLILQGRGETSMSTETPSTEGYQKMPPPPPPKKGKWGYEAYMNRMAAEEQKYHEEQAKKWEEWNQTSKKFKVVNYGFAANEPHPNDDVLCWLQWNDDNLKSYAKWAMELQSVYPCDYRELARRIYLTWQWLKAVNKLGILNIPCPPAPDHLRVWMFKVDDLAHMRLLPNHYLCIQYTWALQFTATTTTSAAMCRPADCLTAFITSMSPFLYHHREYVVKPCPHPTLPEVLPWVHTSSTSCTVLWWT